MLAPKGHLEQAVKIKGKLKGVDTSYGYIGMEYFYWILSFSTNILGTGVAGSLFAIHTEDANLCSVNVLLSGASKVWFFVPFSERESFEAYLRFLFLLILIL